MARKTEDTVRIGGMLGEGIVMEGTLTFSQTFRIDGEFKGKILRSDCLVVGTKGKVSGEVEVNSLIVYGRVEGNVKVKGSVEIHPKGRITGDVEMVSPVLKIMEGGFLEGSLKLNGNGGKRVEKALPSKQSTLIMK